MSLPPPSLSLSPSRGERDNGVVVNEMLSVFHRSKALTTSLLFVPRLASLRAPRARKEIDFGGE